MNFQYSLKFPPDTILCVSVFYFFCSRLGIPYYNSRFPRLHSGRKAVLSGLAHDTNGFQSCFGLIDLFFAVHPLVWGAHSVKVGIGSVQLALLIYKDHS